jgi:hypothetical protein
MWQSLSFGANYKAAYCMAVCPAGENVIAPFLTDRKQFLDDVVRPLQNKPETVYVVPNSDAEEFVTRRFPHKKTKRVSNGLAGQGTIRSFLRGLNFVFQKGQSKGLNAVYHFTFTGQEEVKATVTIRDEKLQVSGGHNGEADLRLTADTETWLRFLRKEASLVWALLGRKIRRIAEVAACIWALLSVVNGLNCQNFTLLCYLDNGNTEGNDGRNLKRFWMPLDLLNSERRGSAR